MSFTTGEEGQSGLRFAGLTDASFQAALWVTRAEGAAPFSARTANSGTARKARAVSVQRFLGLAQDAHLRQRAIDLTNQLATRPASDFTAIRLRWAAAIKASELDSTHVLRALDAPSVQAPAATLSPLFLPPAAHG